MTALAEMTLEQAREFREEERVNVMLSERVDVLLSSKTVGPEARAKLKNLLKFYAKKAKPFTACKRDNMKRFGPGGVDRVCATLKDIIRGTTKWRKQRRSLGMSEADELELMPEVDDETFEALELLSEEDISALLEEAA
jgi:hypothetical protein